MSVNVTSHESEAFFRNSNSSPQEHTSIREEVIFTSAFSAA